MFEQSVLDNIRRPRSKWSFLGIAVQAGVVAALLLVPMVSPEVLSVMLPKALIYVPARQPAPVEVEVRPASAAPSGGGPAVVTARPAQKIFTAPRTYSNPVNHIVDDASFAPPVFAVGGGTAIAAGPLAPATGLGGLPSAPPVRRDPPRKQDPPAPIRVGGQVQAANILHRVDPPYPPLAKQARVSGAVRLEGIIARDGSIQQLKVVSGHPLLVPAAVEAVRQWRYRPTLLNGEPVEVIAPIEVNFVLSR